VIRIEPLECFPLIIETAKSVGVDPNSSDIGRFSGATCKVERARFHIDATRKVERAPARRGRRDQLIWAIHVLSNGSHSAYRQR